MNTEYSEHVRPLTEAERAYVLGEIDRWRETSQEEQGLRRRRGAIGAYLRAFAMWGLCAAVLFVAAAVNEGASHPFLKASAAAAALAIPFWLAARRDRRQIALAIAYGEDNRANERERWRAILARGAFVTRIKTERYAEVLPNAPGGATYYFADIGAEGVFCVTSEYGRPCGAFEIAGFRPGAADSFTALGDTLRPIKTLRWSDFEAPAAAVGGVRAPFPEHGRRYPVAFDKLTSLLAAITPNIAARIEL